MGIEEAIVLNISRETTAVSRAGFGIGMFLGAHKRFTDRRLSVNTAQAVLDAGFLSTDDEYIAAQKYFSQERKPTALVIGRRGSADAVTLTFPAPTTGETYSVVVNGETLSFTATVAETTAAELAAAFETANSAGFTTAAITFDDSAADGSAIIAPTVASTDYSITDESNITVSVTFPESLTDALNAVIAEEDDFYGVMCYSHVKADVTELAAAVQPLRKLYFTSSSEAAIVDTTDTSDTDSVAAQLKAGNYDRTILLYSAVANTQYPEAAQMGEGLPTDPGSRTWAYKTLAGITNDKLTSGQITNAKDKNCNVYTRLLDVPSIRDGKVASGEYIDIMRGVDWLHARLLERIALILFNAEKIPYTDTGLTVIRGAIAAQRQDGIDADFLSGSLDDTIVIPTEASINPVDKAARSVPGITFSFELAGAAQFFTINGSVTI